LAILFKDELVGEKAGDLVVARLSENVANPTDVDLHWGTGFGAAVFVTHDQPGQRRGTLVMQSFGLSEDDLGEPEVLAENARIDAAQVIFLDYAMGSGTLARLAIETDDDGRPEFDELSVLADGVAQLPGVTVTSQLGVLVDYEDDLGNLALFSYDPKAKPVIVAHDVPVQRHARDSERVRSAFVADFNGETGTAYVLDDGDLQRLGEHVLPGTLSFVQEPESVAYLRKRPGSSVETLVLYLLEARLEIVVHDSVVEYHALPWPSPGLLYSVDRGSDQGVWFARAR
jgi:hypothetical protein